MTLSLAFIGVSWERKSPCLRLTPFPVTPGHPENVGSVSTLARGGDTTWQCPTGAQLHGVPWSGGAAGARPGERGLEGREVTLSSVILR